MIPCIARQPIFDRKRQTFGYELLFRADAEADSANVSAEEYATTSVLKALFTELDFQKVSGGRPALINFPPRLLGWEYILSLPSTLVMIDVTGPIPGDEATIKALQKLSRKGFWIAVDDEATLQGPDEIRNAATIIKVDALDRSEAILTQKIQALTGKRNRKVLAHRIETQEAAVACQRAGCDYFQGFFLHRPATVADSSFAPADPGVLQLVAALQNPDATTDALEEVICNSPTLSYRLLRYLSSPAMRGQSVTTVRAAITFMGRTPLRNWATLLALGSQKGTYDELPRILLTRGRMCQLLASAAGLDPDTAFTVGLLSGLDVAFHRPMRTLLEGVHLPEDVRQAILADRGSYGSLLATARAYETGDWNQAQLTDDLQMLRKQYLQAVAWAEEKTQGFQQIAGSEPPSRGTRRGGARSR